MATLKDIAKATNMSITTVSRVINGDSTLQLSDENRYNILKVANELEYRIKKTSTNLHVEIISWISRNMDYEDNYYYNIRAELIELMDKEQITYGLNFKNFQLNKLRSTDAIVVIGNIDSKSADNLKQLCKNIVVIDSCPDNETINSIEIDYNTVSENILKLYKKNHYKKLIYLESKPRPIKQSLSLILSDLLVLETAPTMDSAYSTINMIETNQLYQSLIYCDNDVLTLGVTRALHEKSIKIGNQTGIIGTHNLKVSKFNYPSITTFDTNQSAIALETLRIVKDNYLGINSIKNVKIQPRIIKRESTQL